MTTSDSGSPSSPHVVIVGAGFAGFHAARSARRRLGREGRVTIVNPTNYFLYLPLLPEVAAGILDPRRIAVPLPAALRGVDLVLGEVDTVDVGARTIGYADPEGRRGELRYDRLVLAAGSVNKLLPVPGVNEHAHGFRGLPEALYLRDHITRQVELAATATDPLEREARCTFVVVGAGYTGTEVAAQGPTFTAALARGLPQLREQRMRWILLDTAPRVLPTLDERLARTADTVLRERGVEVRMGQSVQEATYDGVELTDGGGRVPTRTLVWCVGVRPDPLIESTDLPTEKGRLCVGTDLTVPGHPEIFAAGDAAAVADLTRPGELTAMTAQHAERQGALAGRNVVASLRGGTLRHYKHHDLGFVVDLGGFDAAANPLRIPLSGLPAKIVTRSYHLLAMPGNRIRTAADWALDAALPRQSVHLDLVRAPAVPLDTATPEQPRVP